MNTRYFFMPIFLGILFVFAPSPDIQAQSKFTGLSPTLVWMSTSYCPPFEGVGGGLLSSSLFGNFSNKNNPFSGKSPPESPPAGNVLGVDIQNLTALEVGGGVSQKKLKPFSSFAQKKSTKLALNNPAPSEYSGLRESYYTSLYDGKVKIYKLKKDRKNYGHSVWLYRTDKKVKAKYFADKLGGKSIYERYTEWKVGKKVISYCSGPYTTRDYTKPHGLTIDAGVTVNEKVDEDLDALVIVEQIGGVRVADLDEKNCINLVSINERLNPRKGRDLTTFIEWAADEKATVFQTNLMYFKNTKKFGSKAETAKRRIFVLAYDKSEVVHIIFDIEPSVSLTEVAEDIYTYLKEVKKLKIIGVLNFDTGMYDIFQVFKASGQKDPNIKGTTAVSSAKNLMVYYYE